MGAQKSLRTCVFLSVILLFLPALLLPASVATATGHFEVYCDGIGIFLSNVGGAPAKGKLVLFSRIAFPPGTTGGHFGQGMWSDIYVFRDGCVPDGKCDSIADGKVWIAAPDMPDTEGTPKRISGKYKIDLSGGEHLEGAFVAKWHDRKHPLRLCM